ACQRRELGLRDTEKLAQGPHLPPEVAEPGVPVEVVRPPAGRTRRGDRERLLGRSRSLAVGLVRGGPEWTLHQWPLIRRLSRAFGWDLHGRELRRHPRSEDGLEHAPCRPYTRGALQRGAFRDGPFRPAARDAPGLLARDPVELELAVERLPADGEDARCERLV